MIGEGGPGHDIGYRLSLAFSLKISFHSNFCLTGGENFDDNGLENQDRLSFRLEGGTTMTLAVTYHSINFHLSLLLASIGEVL